MKTVKKTNATTCTTIANTSTVISDAPAQSATDLSTRVMSLISTLTPLHQAFATAQNAITTSKADVASQQARMAAITVVAAERFKADLDAAEAMFLQCGVKGRGTVRENLDYFVAKWLTGKSGGPASKMAVISAGLRAEGITTEAAALQRISQGNGFAKVYEGFKPKSLANDNAIPDLTGARVIIQLPDDSIGIVNLSPAQIMALAKKRGTEWRKAANDAPNQDASSVEMEAAHG